MVQTTGEGNAGLSSDLMKQAYRIRDIGTQSVVLYPARAHITRELKDVQLKAGVNEVEILGLSPTVDEHSIQIEAHGLAKVIDMSIELVPNREIYDEVYPEDEDADEESSDEDFYVPLSDSDYDDETAESKVSSLSDLKRKSARQRELLNCADEQLVNLEKYTKTANTQSVAADDMSKLLTMYQQERARIFDARALARGRCKDLEKQIERARAELYDARKESRLQKKLAEKQKIKERRRKQLRKEERESQADHVKRERLKYWPKEVYKVTLLLENSSFDTPGPSRRNSLDSIRLASPGPPDPKESHVSVESASPTLVTVPILLSYVTKEAGWTPRYDLQISSIQNSAKIIYRTEFTNRTSEVWKDAKLSFSTSQTSYQGLDDVVPFMHSWRVTLTHGKSSNSGLLSDEEGAKPRVGRPASAVFNRADLFGIDEGLDRYGMDEEYIPETFGQPPFENARHVRPTVGRSTLTRFHMPEAERNVALDRGVTAARSAPKKKVMRSYRPMEQQRHAYVAEEATTRDIEKSPFALDNEENSVEEPCWEDNGLTTAFEVAGLRTLEPSSLTRRHKIASLQASSILLSHICVPKLRSAAFLRAKIRNPSASITLLKGSAGVTLDGSFLGNMTLPRVSPHEVFDLSLGVDPAIHVNYPKPSVHRSTQGFINKESAEIFTRSIWINNTKPSAVELLALDQIPVSNDERLRINIIKPPGLGHEGDSVKAGVSAKEGSNMTANTRGSRDGKGEDWGAAIASLKKGGEVAWNVKLRGGKGCLLKLEYEAKLPNADSISNA